MTGRELSSAPAGLRWEDCPAGPKTRTRPPRRKDEQMPDDEKPMIGQKPQKLKKSETLEVRIPYETKQAFLTACREDGTTASEVVREKISSYLDERERPIPQPERSNVVEFVKNLHPTVRRYGPRVAASGVAALALATFAALPSAAAPDFQSQFKKYDLNGDGVVTLEEFTGRTGGPDASDDTTIETRIIRSTKGKDGKDGTIVIEKSDKPMQLKTGDLKQDAFSFWLPEDLTGGADDPHNTEYHFATASQIRIDTDGKVGDIDIAPLVISRGGMQKREFEGFDTDKDGKVNFAEFQARQKAMLTRGFEMLDENGDKVLSQDEYNKIGSPPLPKIDGLDKDSGHRIQIISGGPKYSDEQLKAAFTKLDTNRDKKLSLQEYLPPA
jgi:Ca2+-binding EF-hand superfamily protein